MNESLLSKVTFGVGRLLSHPKESLVWIRRGQLIKDPAILYQTLWYTGSLPRVPLPEILPAAKDAEITLPNSFDREFGTSVTLEESCHLAAMVRATRPGKVLEIGTFDGNTSLVLAANLETHASVVTVDLPPDFSVEKNAADLAHPQVDINVTARSKLGRQLRDHPLASRIRQVYGDSGSLDWGSLGGPFGLIFIDGCHTAAYVRSDSENALRHLAPDGTIIWHDYGMIPDVSIVVDEVAAQNPELNIRVAAGTRLAVGKRPALR